MTTPEQPDMILVATIPGPLPPVPENLIRRRPEDKVTEAAGQIGVDASGLDMEFYQQEAGGEE